MCSVVVWGYNSGQKYARHGWEVNGTLTGARSDITVVITWQLWVGEQRLDRLPRIFDVIAHECRFVKLSLQQLTGRRSALGRPRLASAMSQTSRQPARVLSVIFHGTRITRQSAVDIRQAYQGNKAYRGNAALSFLKHSTTSCGL